MKHSLLIQRPNNPDAATVGGALKAQISSLKYNIVRVAMAYVTVSGIRGLLDALSDRDLTHSQWLVGLDDAVTQPEAIDLLLELDHAETRIASLASSGLRFHPKVCCFSCSSDAMKWLLMLGSANLTKNALNGNAESVAFLEGSTQSDRMEIVRVWRQLWTLGHQPTLEELARYREKYEAAKRARRRLKKITGEPLPPRTKALVLEKDDAELDPKLSNTCWIECGYITAMGRELEFKAEQALFFGLSPMGGDARVFQFQTSAGSIVPLRMKYQKNSMWRLQMNNEVPEVAVGLRPRLPNGKLGRSPYVAVFGRTNDPNRFSLRFLRYDGQAYSRLLKRSERIGTVGRTSARSYGWC